MAEAALYIDNELVARRKMAPPKRASDVNAWSKKALKTFPKELEPYVSAQKAMINAMYDENYVRLRYGFGGIVIDRRVSSL